MLPCFDIQYCYNYTNMSTTTLQVPISKDLKANATEVAKEHGFSSLQEIVRVLLTKFAKRELAINVSDTVFVTEEPAVRLSAKNEKRYTKMLEEIKSGKVKTKTFTDVDSLMKDLMS